MDRIRFPQPLDPGPSGELRVRLGRLLKLSLYPLFAAIPGAVLDLTVKLCARLRVQVRPCGVPLLDEVQCVLCNPLSFGGGFFVGGPLL